MEVARRAYNQLQVGSTILQLAAFHDEAFLVFVQTNWKKSVSKQSKFFTSECWQVKEGQIVVFYAQGSCFTDKQAIFLYLGPGDSK